MEVRCHQWPIYGNQSESNSSIGNIRIDLNSNEGDDRMCNTNQPMMQDMGTDTYMSSSHGNTERHFEKMINLISI